MNRGFEGGIMWADDEQQNSDSNENGLNPDNFEYHFVACYDGVKGNFLSIYGDAADAAKEYNLSVRDVDSASTKGEMFAGVRWKYVSDAAAFELFRTKAQKDESSMVSTDVIFEESDHDSGEFVKKSDDNLTTKRRPRLSSNDGTTVKRADLPSTSSSKYLSSRAAKLTLHDTVSSAIGTCSEEEIVEDSIYWCDSPEEHDVAITQDGENNFLKDTAQLSLIVLGNEKKKNTGLVSDTSASTSVLEGAGPKGKGQNKKQRTKESDQNNDLSREVSPTLDKQSTVIVAAAAAAAVKISPNSAIVPDSSKITAVTSTKEPSMQHVLDTSQLSFAFFGPSPKGKDYGPHFISREKPYFLRNALGFRLVIEAVQVRVCMRVCALLCLPGLPGQSVVLHLYCLCSMVLYNTVFLIYTVTDVTI